MCRGVFVRGRVRCACEVLLAHGARRCGLLSRKRPGVVNPARDGPAHFWACALDICTPTPDLSETANVAGRPCSEFTRLRRGRCPGGDSRLSTVLRAQSKQRQSRRAPDADDAARSRSQSIQETPRSEMAALFRRSNRSSVKPNQRRWLHRRRREANGPNFLRHGGHVADSSDRRALVPCVQR